MKKVFSTKLYKDDPEVDDVIKLLSISSWCKDCEGKTMKECNELGYIVHEDWFVEVEDD